jgi:hypothetical protein
MSKYLLELGEEIEDLVNDVGGAVKLKYIRVQ